MWANLQGRGENVGEFAGGAYKWVAFGLFIRPFPHFAIELRRVCRPKSMVGRINGALCRNLYAPQSRERPKKRTRYSDGAYKLGCFGGFIRPTRFLLTNKLLNLFEIC